MTELLPPPLFDLEPERPARVYRAAGETGDGRCSDCRRPLAGRWTHCCGGADANGSFEICDDCAAVEGRWGITRSTLEMARIRRSVYAAGGGETEVRAALDAAGLTTQGGAA